MFPRRKKTQLFLLASFFSEDLQSHRWSINQLSCLVVSLGYVESLLLEMKLIFLYLHWTRGGAMTNGIEKERHTTLNV